MKALSIKQPWVYAILHEGKDIENRSWKRDFRGWIAIHASGTPRSGAVFPRGHRLPEKHEAHCSAICGVARLVDIVTKSRSKWFQQPGRDEVNYGWVLEDATPLETPIHCKGSLGLWSVPIDIVGSIRRQLPRLDLPDAHSQ